MEKGRARQDDDSKKKDLFCHLNERDTFNRLIKNSRSNKSMSSLVEEKIVCIQERPPLISTMKNVSHVGGLFIMATRSDKNVRACLSVCGWLRHGRN
jgi:hypothetical protein